MVALTLKYVESRFGLTLFSSALGVLVSLLIFSRDDVPEYRMSWILLILVVPIFGCSMYLIFGNKKKGIAQEKRMKKYHELRTSHMIDVFPKALDPEKVLSPDHAKLSRYVSTLTDSKIFENTTTHYYPLGDLCFPHMVEELEKAEKFEEEEHKENSRNSARRKSRGKASWKTGGEAGIGFQSEDVKAPEDKKEEQSEASKEGAVPSDVLGMFGGEDEDD